MQPHPVLPHRFRTEQEKPAFIRELFDAGAPFYDRIVRIGFLGTGTAYRKMAQRRAGLASGMKVLDAAAGTGIMSEAAIQLGVPPPDIVCLDVSPGMLERAQAKLNVTTVVGSADAVPCAGAHFDFVMMGFALRHVAALETTFAEYFRVLRPGGRVLILEITKPENRFGNWWFRLWFRDLYPAFTRLITGSGAAQKMMRYYWETMDAVVTPETILAALRAAGFESVGRHVVARVFSEYTAVKPA